MSRTETAKGNRAAMPETARLVDAFRRAFGADVRVLHATEGDQVRGSPSPPARAMTSDQWLHYLRTGKRPCST